MTFESTPCQFNEGRAKFRAEGANPHAHTYLFSQTLQVGVLTNNPLFPQQLSVR